MLTPAAVPVLRDVKRYRAEVRELMTQGVNPKDLKTIMMGLRKMKQNLTSRLAEAAEQRQRRLARTARGPHGSAIAHFERICAIRVNGCVRILERPFRRHTF